MNNILDQIISYKKKWILKQQKKNPLHILKSQIQISQRDFYQTISSNTPYRTKFILEYKRASPSQGNLCNNSNLHKIARIYKNYASIISVVTDKKYFHGNFKNLYKISQIAPQPILCKDFFISEWQIYFARLHQADAILLMLSILNDISYKKLETITHKLGMGILTEIANKHELDRAQSLGAKIIGINNRNLHNLSVDLNRTIILSKNISNKTTIISESGIHNHYQIKYLKNYVNGFLIGTTLMSQPNIKNVINKLILGENKICGLTRIKDAYIAQKAGAVYGGLIFIPNSLRYVNVSTAKRIISSVKYLNYVGVFQNATISYVIEIANSLHLSAIQLHGTENQSYINILRNKLPTTCHIWKSIDMRCQILPKYNFLNVDRYLVDNGGGSGKPFDWSRLSNMPLDQIILAGGLTINNCIKAVNLGCIGLDFNSGVEIKPGIKNHKKIIKIFQILRSY